MRAALPTTALAVLAALPASAQAMFCVTDLACTGSPDNCAATSLPVSLARGTDYAGQLRIDNGPDMAGQITAVAGQYAGRFADLDGNAWRFDGAPGARFVLVARIERPVQDAGITYYEGSCGELK